MSAWTAADIDTLARTLYGEARGSTQEDRRAVAHVILNRARVAREFVAANSPGRTRHPLFGPGTIEGACKAPWQFSCWNDGDPNRPKLLAVTMADPTFLRCLMDAAAVVLGEHAAPFPASTTHYYAKTMPAPPAWARGHTPVATIGGHLFFNTVK